MLSENGFFVFTVPLYDNPRTVERARIVNGTPEFLLPPEYHDDGLRGRGKVLTFRNYGLDIVERLAEAGLKANILPVDSEEHGIKKAKVIIARKGS